MFDEYGKSGLLAIDAGLNSGMALFDESGKLVKYQGLRMKNAAVLKKQAYKILKEIEPKFLIIEGGGQYADIWMKLAEKFGIQIKQAYAEDWREDMLLKRQQRDGKQAKRCAKEVAREIIEEAGISRPKTLKHDTAEAILLGKWATIREF